MLTQAISDANHAGSVADRAAKNAKWIADGKAAAKRAQESSARMSLP